MAQRMTMSSAMSGTTSDKEWQWITMNDNEWQGVVQQVIMSDTTNESEWEWI